MTEAKTNDPSLQRISLPALGTASLLAILIAFGLHALFISGPAMRAAARGDLKQAIVDEDRDVCATLGIRATDTAFPACSRGLAIVRQKQVDRDTAATLGVL
jgi:hypothetical protein